MTETDPTATSWPSLDEILTEQRDQLTGWDDVRMGMVSAKGMAPVNGVAAWSLEQRAQTLDQHEERLTDLLGALGALVGAPVLVEIREQVAGMLAAGRALFQSASTAEGSWQGAQQRLREVLTEREASRDTAVLLEGALEQAHDRERQVRAVLADLVATGAGDGADLDVVERLTRALDTDPTTIDLTETPSA